jgi:hypothetical protein
MDEEYVQEHILTGGIVGPVGGASPTHSWPLTTISLGIVASYPTHLRPFTDHRDGITAERTLGELFAQAGSCYAVANDDERFAHRNPKFSQERRANGRVIGCLHAIVDVSLGKSARRRQHGFEIAQTVDHNAQRRHQLAALFRHIAA